MSGLPADVIVPPVPEDVADHPTPAWAQGWAAGWLAARAPGTTIVAECTVCDGRHGGCHHCDYTGLNPARIPEPGRVP